MQHNETRPGEACGAQPIETNGTAGQVGISHEDIHTCLRGSMCSHYEAPSPQQVAEAFGVALFDQGRLDLWPGYIGPFLRRPDGLADDNDSPATMEVLTGSFGLIPSWSKDSKFAKRIYNARSETVAEKPSYRHAWRQPSVILNTALLSQQRWPLGWVIPTWPQRCIGNAGFQALDCSELNAVDKQQLQLVNQQPGMKLTGLGKHN
ncbi:hypothetical protein BV326_05431 [Pseudomonas syringae pv. actinidiae]|nr:SOS response-associated peptidase family protein [Pseudomonas syringae]OSR65118.1 hypothetical protein BV326_05431 [Pseudomonas syringae pv. actinidiae]